MTERDGGVLIQPFFFSPLFMLCIGALTRGRVAGWDLHSHGDLIPRNPFFAIYNLPIFYFRKRRERCYFFPPKIPRKFQVWGNIPWVHLYVSRSIKETSRSCRYDSHGGRK
ncbi:hypothetical protein F4821DRAFT_95305 [Hypoxylon rubiginosum]|uniref:Uncharacterized protein n=1 Tax=Hypoxylon rubiginosum TaxID=110542 RepID=A0ACC0D623_9PEZI|nr:hypothetical protein F4821DRAFT_95305 [Hypoxylon rubiginosum]